MTEHIKQINIIQNVNMEINIQTHFNKSNVLLCQQYDFQMQFVNINKLTQNMWVIRNEVIHI